MLESHQSHGIGTRLLYEVATWMTELGRTRLSVLPIASTDWAVKAGFHPSPYGSYVADARQVPDLRDRGVTSSSTTR